MTTLINSFSNKFIQNPKKLFLIDAIGALLSAFLLGVVLVQYESYFGIPVTTLYFLAALPVCFALFDLYCYLRVSEKIGLCSKSIAVVNLLYCVLSLGLAFYHRGSITYLGWTYIMVEIMIVVILAVIEMKVANSLKK